MKTLRTGKLWFLSILGLCLAGCASTSPNIQQERVRGEEALNQERYGDAISHFREYLSKAPKDGDAHLKLGCALLTNGQLDEAIPQFKDAIRLKPDDPQTKMLIKNSIFGKAEKLFEANKYDLAIRHLISFLTIDANDVDAHIRLTRYFLHKGDDRNAMGSIRKAASLDPKNPEVIELLDFFSRGFH